MFSYFGFNFDWTLKKKNNNDDDDVDLNAGELWVGLLAPRCIHPDLFCIQFSLFL